MTKQLSDCIIAFFCLTITAPVIILVTLVVLIKLGSPVFFKQKRPGLKGKVFEIYKFRTMNEKKDASGDLLQDADRLMPFGRMLRSSSLDELPELINVSRGISAWSVPGHCLLNISSYILQSRHDGHEVRPGITGWAQIHGRNSLSWEEKFALDVWYVDHQSMWLDIRILIITVIKILKREGINAEGEATMPRFKKEIK